MNITRTIKPAVLLTIAGLLLAGAHARAQSRPDEPPVGGAERKAIMDVLRKSVQTSLNRPVLLRVQPPSGFRGTRYADREHHRAPAPFPRRLIREN